MWRRREKTGTALYDESGCNMDMTRRSPGCGSQRLLRYRSHPAGRGPNSSSLFPPLAAVVAVAHYICKWLNRFDKDRKPD